MMVILKIHVMILMDDFHCVISFFLACIQVFTIIKGIYKCYEHFNHKTIKIFLWEGMDCKKSIWMTFHPVRQLQDFHFQKSCDHGKKSVMEANPFGSPTIGVRHLGPNGVSNLAEF